MVTDHKFFLLVTGQHVGYNNVYDPYEPPLNIDSPDFDDYYDETIPDSLGG